MEQLERLTARLDNVQAVEPILNALRAISSSSRLMALGRFKSVSQFRDELAHILAWVRPRVTRARRAPNVQAKPSGPRLLLVVGSERGLCGAFNEVVVDHAQQVLARHEAAGIPVQLVTLGARARQALQRGDRSPLPAGRLATTGLPPYALADQLAEEWLRRYEARDLRGVDVIYNSYQGLARHEPRTSRLLPADIPYDSPSELTWSPWIETDPVALYDRLVRLWLSATLYALLLEASAAEHSARFRLLEGASQNAENLIDELRLFLQTARQDAITAELQDLASGAGLLGRRSD